MSAETEFLHQFQQLPVDEVQRIADKVELNHYKQILALEPPLQQCPICSHSITTAGVLRCGHVFCFACITDWLHRDYSCPLCRKMIVTDAHIVKVSSTLDDKLGAVVEHHVQYRSIIELEALSEMQSRN